MQTLRRGAVLADSQGWRDPEAFQGVAGLNTKHPSIRTDAFPSCKILNQGLAFPDAELKFTGK